MKKIISILICIFNTNFSIAQTCNYAIETKFFEYYNLLFEKSFFSEPSNSVLPQDRVYCWNFKGNTYKLPPAPTTITEAICQTAFNSLEDGARLIESLLLMYETTHDKAYQHWAMDLSVHWNCTGEILAGKQELPIKK